MTYKTTQENADWLKRTGSHATRPFANGRIDDLPAWAKEPEEYYNSLRSRWDILQEQLHKAREAVHAGKMRLRSSMPLKEYQSVSFRHAHDVEKLQTLEKQSSDLRPLVRAAAMNSFGIVYFLVCENMLEKDLRIKLQREVEELLGRQITDDIRKSRSEMTQEQRHKDNRKRAVRQKAQKQRDKSSDGKRLVWSDTDEYNRVGKMLGKR